MKLQRNNALASFLFRHIVCSSIAWSSGGDGGGGGGGGGGGTLFDNEEGNGDEDSDDSLDVDEDDLPPPSFYVKLCRWNQNRTELVRIGMVNLRQRLDVRPDVFSATIEGNDSLCVLFAVIERSRTGRIRPSVQDVSSNGKPKYRVSLIFRDFHHIINQQMAPAEITEQLSRRGNTRCYEIITSDRYVAAACADLYHRESIIPLSPTSQNDDSTGTDEVDSVSDDSDSTDEGHGSVDDGGSTDSFANAEEDDTVGSAGNADDGQEDASDEDGEEEDDDLRRVRTFSLLPIWLRPLPLMLPLPLPKKKTTKKKKKRKAL